MRRDPPPHVSHTNRIPTRGNRSWEVKSGPPKAVDQSSTVDAPGQDRTVPCRQCGAIGDGLKRGLCQRCFDEEEKLQALEVPSFDETPKKQLVAVNPLEKMDEMKVWHLFIAIGCRCSFCHRSMRRKLLNVFPKWISQKIHSPARITHRKRVPGQ